MTRLFQTTALCSMLAASPAFADITVDDAWSAWKAQVQALGLTMDASESRDGDALQIGDMRLSVAFPEDAGNAYLTMSGPRFVPADGGTVEVHFPAKTQITMGGDIKGEGSMSMVLEMTGDDAPGIMSGDPNNVKTVWGFANYEATLGALTINGEPAKDVSGKMLMGPTAMTTLTNIGEAMVTVTNTTKMESYKLDYTATIVEGAADLKIEAGGAAKGIDGTSTFMLPKAGLDVLGLDKQLEAGLKLVLTSKIAENASYQRTFIDGRQVGTQDTTAADYDITVNLDKSGLDYGGTAGAFKADLLMPEMPLPISISGEGAGGRILLPLMKSEEAQPAAIKMALNGVSISDQLWGMFDPAATLPRDPMTIAFDVSGDTKLLFNFLDIRAIMGGAQPAGLPVTAERVKLNSLMIKGVGAELTGTGDFTFDYSDWTTFGGMPAPEGQAAFMLKGANGLMDKLVAMGLITEQDTMGARMMMGMFAKPGEGEDVLTTEIDVKKTGEVSANGQRLR
ncbi:DUF2125 domain-containing protein [Rhodobacteraceae bacterium D3-12]|nr:DUF2125 domain-containing protein [Rhodobacteraceae bacterium D3-12]